jgi:hypothetical protein
MKSPSAVLVALLAALGCAPNSAAPAAAPASSAAGGPTPLDAASDAVLDPVASSGPASRAEGSKRECFCFDWVQDFQFGFECYKDRAACGKGKAALPNPRSTTGCESRKETGCIKWGCRNPGGDCYRYGHDG